MTAQSNLSSSLPLASQKQGESTIEVATLPKQPRLVSAFYAPATQDQLTTQLAEPARGTQGAANTGYLRGLMAQETVY